MTASFSLRLRLKVYSLKMRFAAKAVPRSTLQRPTVNETLIPSAAGSPSALARIPALTPESVIKRLLA
jgi:hypothetical protein